MVRFRVLYSGRVQGVGFRYTTQRIASALMLCGYVRNLPGGRVEVLVEGEPVPTEALLVGVREQFADHILEEQLIVQSATGEFKAFQVLR